MSLEEKLRPCLFCGSNGVKIMRCNCECAHMRKPHYVLCGACGANGPVNDEPGKYWNKAHCWKLLDEKNSQIAELVEAIRIIPPENLRFLAAWTEVKSGSYGSVEIDLKRLAAEAERLIAEHKASKDDGDK